MKLKDQVAIVTGAGRNIGEEIAKVLAANGAKVAVVDMDPGRGSKVAGEIVGHGGEAAAFVADISSEADVARLIKDIASTSWSTTPRSPTTRTSSRSPRTSGTRCWPSP
jgi:3-oxoacyl-[acyl-carrier protein] reductase